MLKGKTEAEKAEAASVPQGATGARATPVLATVVPQKKLFYYDFLIFPSNESLRVATIYTAFSDRQHQICQRSTHAMGGITWHSHPNSHRNTAKRWHGCFCCRMQGTLNSEGLISLLSALRRAPLRSCPAQNQQAQPHLSFLFLTLPKAEHWEHHRTPSCQPQARAGYWGKSCWSSTHQLSWWTVLERWSATQTHCA